MFYNARNSDPGAEINLLSFIFNRGIIEIVDPKGVEGRAAFMTGKVKVMFKDIKRHEPGKY